MTLHFSIITPEKTVFTGDVNSVQLPTVDGEIGVYPNHIPLVGIIKSGVAILRKEHEEDRFVALSGGYVEVQKDRVIVLADTAERAEDIDLERAEAARKRAEELMRQKVSAEDVDYVALAAQMEKELARVKARKRKYRDVGGG